MSQISTISEFLLQAGTEYRVFDMARTIRKVSTQAFMDTENNLTIPQYPRAQHAWYSILFWNKNLSNQHYIWFLKLPLDEQGLIMPAGRNHFLQIIVEALGQQLEHAEQKNGQLPDNPYRFIPNQQQLADFNSISRHHLNLSHSDHYHIALNYFNNPKDVDWQQVPLQGIADIAANMTNSDISKLLCRNFLNLADEVKFALLTSLENQKVEIKLVEQIALWLAENSASPVHWQHGLRALCQSPCKGLVIQLIEKVLHSPLADNADLLTVISGRLWSSLSNESILKQYLQAVLKVDPRHHLFGAIYRDLVQIPEMRNHLLDMLRWADKSPELTTAVGKLFSGQ